MNRFLAVMASLILTLGGLSFLSFAPWVAAVVVLLLIVVVLSYRRLIKRAPRPCVKKFNDQSISTRTRFWNPIR